ncbi:MAG: NGG1p interacting factor NIF3 [Chitinophagaceae bacterium]|nr:MAG: NGG1p interacting factor NIF3 [Chitinophagaceae bacterium]
MRAINPQEMSISGQTRRKFISITGKALASAALLSPAISGFSTPAPAAITVGDVMDAFIAEVPGAPFEKTVDTLKAGKREINVTGIITTMFATLEIIQKAISTGVNFIIPHEPVFYNHLDQTDWLESDDVYRYKSALLKKHNIAVWRNHDYIHSHVPDGVDTNVVKRLGWAGFYDAKTGVAAIPPMNLQQLIGHMKTALQIKMLRYIGSPQLLCKKIVLMPGASGGQRHIREIEKHKPDVLICGEVQEWETAEYVRDARTKGDKIALIVLGHIPSEEPGSEYMAEWLKKKFPSLKTAHVPAENPFSFA